MQLTKFTDYGLRALIFIGNKDDDLSTVSEISEFYNISYNHLIKVIHKLSKLGIIETFKGKGGGVKLAKDPAKINLGQLIRQLETGPVLVECFSEKGNCKINFACRLKGILARALENFYKELEKFCLKDILKPIKINDDIFKF